MGARSYLPSIILPPDGGILPPQPDFVPVPYELPSPLSLEPSPRAAASWPSRTWSPAERVTAGMLNGWRDQLNDLHTQQQTFLRLMPTVVAHKYGSTQKGAAEVLDFVQMPSNMSEFDMLVIDVEYSMFTNISINPYRIFYWNQTVGGIPLVDVASFTGHTSSGGVRFTMHRHPQADNTLFMIGVGGPYNAPGFTQSYFLNITTWATLFLYLQQDGVPSGGMQWKWTITHYGT